MYDVIVIGGGVAGCAISALLAQRGVTVQLVERGSYPAHKICGEFLSIETQAILDRLGLPETLERYGAAAIDKVTITSQFGRRWQGRLPGTAYGLSRYKLDEQLFEHARTSGGECRVGVTANVIEGEFDRGFTVSTSAGNFRARMVIAAVGKKSTLGRLSGQKHNRTQSSLVGYKQHYTGECAEETIEVHLFDRGYCGINRIEDGLVNVCWVADRSLLDENGGNHREVMKSVMATNSFLRDRLERLTPIDRTLCAIGGITLQHRGLFQGDVCYVGDSAQMIAPFCGDGMGMALRSAELLSDISYHYLNGAFSKNTFKHKYTEIWKSEFSQRLQLGKILQSAALSRYGAPFALSAVATIPSLGKMLIERTRGADKPPSRQIPTDILR